MEFDVNGQRQSLTGQGDGAISAFVNSLNLPVRIVDYHEHAIGTGTETRAACYVEVKIGDSLPGFGVGVDVDIVTASFKAVLSALNRYIQENGMESVESGSTTSTAA